MRGKLGVVQAGAYLAGKEKGPADTDGPDGVEFVGVKEYFCLQAFGAGSAAVAVAANTVADLFYVRAGKSQILQNKPGHDCAVLGVADFSLAPAFFPAADVMQESRGSENVFVGAEFPPYPQRHLPYPLTVVGSVGTALFEAVIGTDFLESLEPCRVHGVPRSGGSGHLWPIHQKIPGGASGYRVAGAARHLRQGPATP